MGSLTVGGQVTGHSSIMVNNMDLVFSQSGGGVNLNREGQLSNDNSASTKEKGWVEYNGLKSVLRTKRLEFVQVHILRKTHGGG